MAIDEIVLIWRLSNQIFVFQLGLSTLLSYIYFYGRSNIWATVSGQSWRLGLRIGFPTCRPHGPLEYTSLDGVAGLATIVGSGLKSIFMLTESLKYTKAIHQMLEVSEENIKGPRKQPWKGKRSLLHTISW